VCVGSIKLAMPSVHRACALWLLGYPEAALADAAQLSATHTKSNTPLR
jgi:hypothetical protein